MIKNPFFPETHGNFGFGCMRLPMKDDKVNNATFGGGPDHDDFEDRKYMPALVPGGSGRKVLHPLD